MWHYPERCLRRDFYDRPLTLVWGVDLASQGEGHPPPIYSSIAPHWRGRMHHDLTFSPAAAGSDSPAMVITANASSAPARGNAAGLPAKLAAQPRHQVFRNDEVDGEARSNHGGKIMHIQQFLLVASARPVATRHPP